MSKQTQSQPTPGLFRKKSTEEVVLTPASSEVNPKVRSSDLVIVYSGAFNFVPVALSNAVEAGKVGSGTTTAGLEELQGSFG